MLVVVQCRSLSFRYPQKLVGLLTGSFWYSSHFTGKQFDRGPLLLGEIPFPKTNTKKSQSYCCIFGHVSQFRPFQSFNDWLALFGIRPNLRKSSLTNPPVVEEGPVLYDEYQKEPILRVCLKPPFSQHKPRDVSSRHACYRISHTLEGT